MKPKKPKCECREEEMKEMSMAIKDIFRNPNIIIKETFKVTDAIADIVLLAHKEGYEKGKSDTLEEVEKILRSKHYNHVWDVLDREFEAKERGGV